MKSEFVCREREAVFFFSLSSRNNSLLIEFLEETLRINSSNFEEHTQLFKCHTVTILKTAFFAKVARLIYVNEHKNTIDITEARRNNFCG